MLDFNCIPVKKKKAYFFLIKKTNMKDHCNTQILIQTVLCVFIV